jgi:hypothetical protein
MESSIAININNVTYKKEERSFLSGLRNRLSSNIILPTTINKDNTRCKDFDFNNINCLLPYKKNPLAIHPDLPVINYEDKNNSVDYCDMV